MEIAQNELLLFVKTFMYAYIILFPGKLSAVFIILIESMNKIKDVLLNRIKHKYIRCDTNLVINGCF